MSLYVYEHTVSFGDCDPAGIVYYPNFCDWTDATFHGYLRDHGPGHRSLCAELGARGLGLMEVGMRFRSPAVDGDRLAMVLESIDWSERSFRVNYRALIGDRLVLDGFETRGVFVPGADGRIRAAPVAPLRQRLG